MDMMLQLERLAAGSVNAGQNVLFDTTLISVGDISYDNTAGLITLLQPGRYQFNWWVAPQTASTDSGIVFALRSSQNDVVIGNSPQRNGEVVGMAVVEVAVTPVTVSLQNENGMVFYDNSIPVKASLTVWGSIESVSTANFIIPYSGGINLALTTTEQGEPEIAAMIGFGSMISIVAENGQINERNEHLSFLVPRDSVINSAFTFFNIQQADDLGESSVQIVAQFYRAGLSDNLFMPIPETRLELPPVLTGIVPVGQHLYAETGDIAIPVAKGTRIMLAYMASVVDGPPNRFTFLGYGDAGLSMS